eukprot:scaffold23209_cov25-Tisochrysis_lutea.AAC.2
MVVLNVRVDVAAEYRGGHRMVGREERKYRAARRLNGVVEPFEGVARGEAVTIVREGHHG